MHLDMTVTVSATFRSTSRHVLGPSEREQDASSTPGGFHKAYGRLVAVVGGCGGGRSGG